MYSAKTDVRKANLLANCQEMSKIKSFIRGSSVLSQHCLLDNTKAEHLIGKEA